MKGKIAILVVLICIIPIGFFVVYGKQNIKESMNRNIVLMPYIEDGVQYLPTSDSTYEFAGLCNPIPYYDKSISFEDPGQRQHSDNDTLKSDLVIRSYIPGPKGYEHLKFPVTSIQADVFYIKKFRDDIDIEWHGEPPTGESFLKLVVIPNTVTKIGSNAFRDCENLTSVVIPSSVTSIGVCAFKNTPFAKNLQKREQFVIINGNLIDASGCKEPNVIIPKGVTNIVERAFMQCNEVKSVAIPEGVTHIGYEAFLDCKNLQSIEIPTSVMKIDPYAFKNTPFLNQLQQQNPLVVLNGILVDASTYKEKTLEIPEGVVSMSFTPVQSAIDKCQITSIVIPSSIEVIESYSFSGLYYLQNVIIQEGVKKIESDAFSNCNNLVHVEIKGTKTVIDKNGFRGCKFISDVVIPQNNISYAEMEKQRVDIEVASVDGKIDNHDYVDLGLPSGRLWSTCNVGATDYLKSGTRYAWGETQEKEKYELNNYKWCNEKKKATKYCVNSEFGVIVDNKTKLDVEDDVANVIWGNSWRMPTMEEWKELMNGCEWHVFHFYSKEYKSEEGGMVGVSKQNGQKIILPFGGTFWGDEVKNSSDGFYRSVDGEDEDRKGDDYSGLHCSGVKMNEFTFTVTTLYRFLGHLVRPVVNDETSMK